MEVEWYYLLSVFVRYTPIIKLECFIDKYVPVNYRIVLLFLYWHNFVAISSIIVIHYPDTKRARLVFAQG